MKKLFSFLGQKLKSFPVNIFIFTNLISLIAIIYSLARINGNSWESLGAAALLIVSFAFFAGSLLWGSFLLVMNLDIKNKNSIVEKLFIYLSVIVVAISYFSFLSPVLSISDRVYSNIIMPIIGALLAISLIVSIILIITKAINIIKKDLFIFYKIIFFAFAIIWLFLSYQLISLFCFTVKQNIF